MFIFTIKDLVPMEDSTVTALAPVPDLPRRSTLTSIGPFVPDWMCHGVATSLATVQPHDVRTAVITTSSNEVLVNQKVKFAVASPGFVVTSFCSASHVRLVSGPVAAGM